MVKKSEQPVAEPRTVSWRPFGEWLTAQGHGAKAKAARSLGETGQTLNNWQKRGVPRDKVKGVSKLMGVSEIRYLLNAGDTDVDPLAAELLDVYVRLDLVGREKLLDFARYLAQPNRGNDGPPPSGTPSRGTAPTVHLARHLAPKARRA